LPDPKPVVADPPDRPISTGVVSVQQKKPDGKPEWELTAQRSSVTYRGDGRLKGSLELVTGKIYDKNGFAADVSADTGEADQTKKRLDLAGHVMIKSKDGKTTLRTGRMRWLADLEMIEAWDGVEVVTDDYKMGPFKRVWATADLSKVGTPDRFLRRLR